ncbi:MAG: FHA domain-containing protein [Planctomycetota bacterium]|nr:FHA domain-containing protein [Planctomycetota bacterium]
MPYLVVNNDRQETEHREISGALVVGRAPDCDISVRDILLSRHHCRLEKNVQGWVLVDLGSKNGTVLNGEKLIEPRVLHENDVVRVGRSKIIFHEGVLDPELAIRPKSARPTDPNESLSGTLSGFTLLMPGEGDTSSGFNPCPQPRPKDPVSYEREDVGSLLSAIASSSWDSIYAEARVKPPSQPQSSAEDLAPRRRRPRPRSPIDLSLQVGSQPSSAGELAAARSEEPITEIFKPAAISLEEAPPLPVVANVAAEKAVVIAVNHSNRSPRAVIHAKRAWWSRLRPARRGDAPLSTGRIFSYVAAAALLLLAVVVFNNGSTPTDGSTPGPIVAAPPQALVVPMQKEIPAAYEFKPAETAAPALSGPADAPIPVRIEPQPNSTNSAITDPAELKQMFSHADSKSLGDAARDAVLHSPFLMW